jgi:predicted P-loop ATPase
MKLKLTIYEDKFGNHWFIQRHSLPKKKGEYTFWTGESPKFNAEFKGNYKREVVTQIQEFLEKNIPQHIPPVTTS